MDKTGIREISAIIAAKGNPALTEQCIRLLGETLAEFHHEIILVEDCSEDGSLQGYEDIQRMMKLLSQGKSLKHCSGFSWPPGTAVIKGKF